MKFVQSQSQFRAVSTPGQNVQLKWKVQSNTIIIILYSNIIKT